MCSQIIPFYWSSSHKNFEVDIHDIYGLQVEGVYDDFP